MSGPPPGLPLYSVRIESSVGGESFEEIRTQLRPTSFRDFVTSPFGTDLFCRFPPRAARYLRLTNGGFWADRWSVAEFQVLGVEEVGQADRSARGRAESSR